MADARTNVANVVKYRGIAQMFVSKTYPMALSRSAALREHCLKALGFAPALVILLCASLVLALETPSKPFLDKNSFYLSSAGFRVQVADDPATKKAMHALPAHRFVIHRFGNDMRYLYSEPRHCVCIFIGTKDAYENYRGMLSGSLGAADAGDTEYRQQADALLSVDPTDFNTIPDSTAVGDILQIHY
jgi:hypothetical protein